MTERLTRIPPFAAGTYLPLLRPWLERATKRCKDETLADVEREVTQGLAQLWVTFVDNVPAGVLVTSFTETPARTVLELRYLAGDNLVTWIHLQRKLAQWAELRGCKAIRLRGRKGWLRVLTKHGWKPTSYEMELAV